MLHHRVLFPKYFIKCVIIKKLASCVISSQKKKKKKPSCVI